MEKHALQYVSVLSGLDFSLLCTKKKTKSFFFLSHLFIPQKIARSKKIELSSLSSSSSRPHKKTFTFQIKYNIIKGLSLLSLSLSIFLCFYPQIDCTQRDTDTKDDFGVCLVSAVQIPKRL